MSNTSKINTITNKTESLKIINGKKKSKHKLTIFTILPKTSARIIGNNLKEKLYQASFHEYYDKQKLLRNNLIKLNEIYQKCYKLSKTMSLPKYKNLDDIEYVVARIVDETFNELKSASGNRFAGNGKRHRVSDSDSDESVHFQVDNLDRARDIRPKSSVGNGTSSRHRVDPMSNASMEEKRTGFIINHGQVAVNRELWKLRKRLAVALDRLKVAEKEKRDLLNAMHRNQSNRTLANADLLQAMLDKEKEKNVYLQSLVDEMYASMKNDKKPPKKVP